MITAEQLIARAVELEDTARRAELAGCTMQAPIDRAIAAELRRLAAGESARPSGAAVVPESNRPGSSMNRASPPGDSVWAAHGGRARGT